MFVVLSYLATTASFATDHYVSMLGGNISPFITWETAATNIQSAIDVSLGGDTVWVTNGVYSEGGRAVAGELTNRVVLDRAVKVKSVNGPRITIIQGEWDPITTNGPTAMRCAWIGDHAVLEGFTLRSGATRSAGDATTLQSGGGAWCNPGGAVVGCILVANAAGSEGGGAYSGNLTNCAIIRNYSYWKGGGASAAMLVNCTVSANGARTGGGVAGGSLRNCIVWGNRSQDVWGGFANYSCGTGIIGGVGNLFLNPQLLSDGIHLSAASPCRGVGAPGTTGTDIDGQPWENAPSMGCDEWHSDPVIALPPAWRYVPGTNGSFVWSTAIGGEPPFSCAWRKDGIPIIEGQKYTGTTTPELMVHGLTLQDAGTYQLFVTSGVGSVASPPAALQVVCVDPGSESPIPPYTNWGSAAKTLQAALAVAAPKALILATNGVYDQDGAAPGSDLTNRVTLGKGLALMSVNGPAATIIEGAWDPATTNGPAAVRCAFVAEGSVLEGFTLRHGATSLTDLSGGGVCCNSTNAFVANCILKENSAQREGGGAYSGTLLNCLITSNFVQFIGGSGGGASAGNLIDCTLTGNRASNNGGGYFYNEVIRQGYLSRCTLRGNVAGFGGGAYAAPMDRCVLIGNSGWSGGGLLRCNATNCSLTQNVADYTGGGAEWSALLHCTVVGNSAGGRGGGTFGGSLTNSIVWGNIALAGSNYYQSSLSFCCSFSLAGGEGNIEADPQVVDGTHIGLTSPCRAAGNTAWTTAADIDGDPWANPPSMGCDEPLDTSISGPIQVSLSATPPVAPAGVAVSFSSQINGRVSRLEWSFGDGSLTTNSGWISRHIYTLPGSYLVKATAFNNDHPVGVSDSVAVSIVPMEPPYLNASLSGSSMELTCSGQAGVTWVLESATNLAPGAVWRPLQFILTNEGIATARIATLTNPACFYRLRLP